MPYIVHLECYLMIIKVSLNNNQERYLEEKGFCHYLHNKVRMANLWKAYLKWCSGKVSGYCKLGADI